MRKIELEVWSVDEKLPDDWVNVIGFFEGGWFETMSVETICGKKEWFKCTEGECYAPKYWCYVPVAEVV